MFVPCKLFQSCLKFAGKAGAYPSEAPLVAPLLGPGADLIKLVSGKPLQPKFCGIGQEPTLEWST